MELRIILSKTLTSIKAKQYITEICNFVTKQSKHGKTKEKQSN